VKFQVDTLQFTRSHFLEFNGIQVGDLARYFNKNATVILASVAIADWAASHSTVVNSSAFIEHFA
jgi:hypothetical protein